MAVNRKARRTRIASEMQVIMDNHEILPPKIWNKLSEAGKLDFIATRILAQSRVTTSHNEMREEGILSVSQYGRRVNREVYSTYGTLEEVPPVRGVFSRVYVSRDSKRAQEKSDLV